MSRATAMTALAGALISLAVVSGFLAIDRTVLHWYFETAPTPAPFPTRDLNVPPTPSGGPSRTALEVSQAVETQIPGWCTSFFAQTLRSSPRWGESSKVWNLGCALLPSIGSSQQPRVSCYRIDDLTLEITLGQSGVSLTSPWDC